MFAVILGVIVERMICCGIWTCIAPAFDTQAVVPWVKTAFGDEVLGVIDVRTKAGEIPETEGGVGVRICWVPLGPWIVFSGTVMRGKYVAGDFETVIVDLPGIDGFRIVCGMICVWIIWAPPLPLGILTTLIWGCWIVRKVGCIDILAPSFAGLTITLLAAKSMGSWCIVAFVLIVGFCALSGSFGMFYKKILQQRENSDKLFSQSSLICFLTFSLFLSPFFREAKNFNQNKRRKFTFLSTTALSPWTPQADLPVHHFFDEKSDQDSPLIKKFMNLRFAAFVVANTWRPLFENGRFVESPLVALRMFWIWNFR